MGERLSALARSLRTFVQGAVAAGALAAWEAAYTSVSGGTFDPRIVVMGVVTAVTGAVVTFAYNKIAPRLGLAESPSLEALIRAGRTLLQAAIAVGLVAIWDAGYAAITAGVFNPADIGKAAVAAAVTAVAAYLHNFFDAKAAENRGGPERPTRFAE